MKISEFMQMPKGLTMAEYETLLNEKKRLEKQVRKYSLLIYGEEDALEVLENETESERYKKHLIKMQQAKTKRDKALKRLEEIKETIKQ